MVKITDVDIRKSIDDFMESWRIVRICPNNIQGPPELLRTNVVTLLCAIVVFAFARASVAGVALNVLSDVSATLVSAAIAFGTGYVTILFNADADTTRKWNLFFVMMWITSLVVIILIDGLPIWNDGRPITTVVIDFWFAPGTLSGFQKNFIRAIITGALASLLLILKTRLMDREFKFSSACAILTVGLGIAINALVLLSFLYGHII